MTLTFELAISLPGAFNGTNRWWVPALSGNAPGLKAERTAAIWSFIDARTHKPGCDSRLRKAGPVARVRARIVVFNTDEGCARDVTVHIADELPRRYAEFGELPDLILDFAEGNRR